jgi:hypothetical protein
MDKYLYKQAYLFKLDIITYLQTIVYVSECFYCCECEIELPVFRLEFVDSVGDIQTNAMNISMVHLFTKYYTKTYF